MVRAESITATLVYTYNADGLRVARAQSVASVESVDTFTWGWATGVPELLSDGESLYLTGYDTLGWQNGADWTFVLPDALGSVRQETDATGTVTAVREWSPYGEELGGTQAGLGYTGEWYDDAIGLVYLRARWHQPTMGRFTQRDPVATSTFYRYASNNPINRVDPSGYIDWSACAIQGDYGICTIQSGDTYYKIARELIAAGVPANLGQIVADLTALNSQQYPNPNSIPIAGALTVRAAWIQAVLQAAEFLPPAPYLPPPIVKTHRDDPLVEILYELGGVNDLEAMARISEVLARYYPNWPEFLDEMSETLLGVRIHGPGSLIAATTAPGCVGLGRDCQDDEPKFLDTGFHPDFQDEGNQLYHVWGYIAETASPEDPHGEWIAYAGNQFHECTQSNWAYFFHRIKAFDLADKVGGGTSWSDYVLSWTGMGIGMDITQGVIAMPQDLGNVLRRRLGTEGPGSYGALEILRQMYGPLYDEPLK